MTNAARFPRGSEWHRWDLHIHTPASLVHHYPGPDEWESFIRGLEALPADIRVIGINDYIFVDGLRRVLEYRRQGRIKNIATILPVVELRLDAFGGTASALSRVNYHVIFSEDVSPELIEQQFLNALHAAYILTPSTGSSPRPTWKGVITRESLADFGQQVIISVPPEKRAQFGTPLQEGFNNLALPLNAVRQALNSTYFAQRHLTAIGKTEWWDIKWNDHSIATKKDLINGADFVFISAESPAACLKARDSLQAARVNSRLLDCSDAHNLADRPTKDRLGKCYTWIKATPTFAGLRQARQQPHRISVGEPPPALETLTREGHRYLSSVSFTRTARARAECTWFSGDLPLNPGFVAVIGNKGSGKSALADIIAYLGHSRANEHFSFLSPAKFLQPKLGLGSMFEATAHWRAGSPTTKTLDAAASPSTPEQVKYIPQNFLESICTDLKLGASDSSFDKELREVIFSHVDDAHRYKQPTLSHLIEYLTRTRHEHIRLLTTQLHAAHVSLVGLEEQATPDFAALLKAKLEARREALAAHDAAKPVAVPEPTQDPSTQAATAGITNTISELVTKVSAADVALARFEHQKKFAALGVSAADRLLARLDNLERQVATFYDDSRQDEVALGVDLKSILSLSVNRTLIKTARDSALRLEAEAKTQLDAAVAGSEAHSRKTLSDTLAATRLLLNEPNRIYQEHLRALATWTKRRDEIVGTADLADSVLGLESLILGLDQLPASIAQARAARDKIVLDIFSAKEQLLGDYKRLYAPVQQFINQHPISKTHGGLEFVASISDENFALGLFALIHQGRKGSFAGEAEGRSVVREILALTDFASSSGVSRFLATIQDRLENDRRDGVSRPVAVREQLKQGKTPTDVYDYVYGLSYLQPRFELRWHGKVLDQLSPGERGALLLMFYLLIDRRDGPLVIDQPEENLDNRTITSLLVPALKYAKERRQIIIVTHNPNLAVVCDADQVIYASIDKTRGNAVEYMSGAIEDRVITEHIVDVLEGTKLAFDCRDAAYDVLE